MDNDWDIYDFLGISAGDDTGVAAHEGLISNHDSFSFPLVVDNAGNEYHDPHNPIDNTSHRMAAQAQPTTAPYGGGGCGVTENFPALFQSLHQRQLQMLKDHNEKNRVGLHSQAAKLRRKKSTTLEVRMRFEMIPKDSWSWRKYGQKPIKGTPHPRSYYRCSSSRSCTARKQVELSQDNPEEYIVSYIGHHTHAKPSALRSNAGSTRHPSPPCWASPSTAAAITCPALTGTPSIVPNHEGEDTQNDDDADNTMPEANDNNEVEEEDDDDQEDDEIILIPNKQIAEELFVAMHGFKPMPPAGGN